MLENTGILCLPLVAILLMICVMDHKYRPLAIFFLLSSTYYGYLGPGYWINVRNSSFIGVHWGADEIISAALQISWSSFFVLLVIQLSDWLAPMWIRASLEKTFVGESTNIPLVIFLALGTMGLIYTSISVSSTGGFNDADRFLLIAYQFSDLLIPVLLYISGTSVGTKVKVVLIGGFLYYAIFLGFRYKAILLIAPILTACFIAPDLAGNTGGIFRRRVIIAAAAVILVVGFSLLTLARTKFEGVDVDAVVNQNTEDFIYGALAESNIIFGQLSIINDFVNQDRSLGFRPFVLAAEEWLPRFIFPEKGANSYMESVLAGLISDEALKSATAYPYIGEYLIMGGYEALPVALIVLALFCRGYSNIIYRCARVPFHREFGLGLLAVFIGYYYFSRGFMPQALKGIIFILLPYAYLLRNSGAHMVSFQSK